MFKFAYLVSQGIPMDSQNLGGFSLVATVFVQRRRNELPFKFGDGFLVKEPMLDHVSYDCFHLVFHDFTPDLSA